MSVCVSACVKLLQACNLSVCVTERIVARTVANPLASASTLSSLAHDQRSGHPECVVERSGAHVMMTQGITPARTSASGPSLRVGFRSLATCSCASTPRRPGPPPPPPPP
eukprot:CAMPEP_0167799286 /NCGR_PEP_ID=MMETSP0111_2-20121227/16903_1 /TAXON_ID=91324 /ORGANISM="Lotharella globosa, Strain CCCM811" /LENGTH=109 /DNA_ID=CAMNT_0007694041 /DNA_START=78 /DNA_END=404 /DNA_ORIENTATION=+